MDPWTARYKQSPIWESLTEIGSAIDLAVNRESLDLPTRENLERLRVVLTFVGKRLDATDGQLVLPGPLDGVSGHFRDILTTLRQFLQTGEPGLVDNLNAAADSGLSYLMQIPFAIGVEELAGQREAVERFRETMSLGVAKARIATESFETQALELRGKLDTMIESVEAERRLIAQLTSDYQGQFSTDQQKRNTEYLAEQQKRNSDYLAAEQSRETAFAQIRERYSETLIKLDSENQRETERISRAQAESLAELQREHVSRAESLLAGIDSQRVAVEKLVGVIGVKGVTYGYKRTADGARWAVWFWQALTVGALVALIVLANQIFGHFETKNADGAPIAFTLWEVVSRLAVTITVGVLAGYAGSQAARYQDVERRNRRLALELEAIGPYVAPLPVEKQEEFRLKIGDRSFGRGDLPTSGKGPTDALSLALQSRRLRKFLLEAFAIWKGGSR
jgi:hypothetical protein